MKKKVLQNMNHAQDWEKIFDSMNDGMYITNAEGLTLKVNQAYEQITGLDSKKLIGKYMTDIVKEGYLSTSITQQVIDSQKPVSVEQQVINGKKVALRGVPIFEDGAIRMVVSFVRDISVINKIQEELNHSKIIIDQYQKQLNDLQQNTFIAESPEFKKVIFLAQKVANVDSTVLILGESGTGKEVVAKQIHEKSSRNKNLFLKINCGAIPEQLLESELFGYEGGAFTGAKKNGHIGIFEMANKGTVFLDEIGDMPLHLQVKLLRVLQEKTITRIGSTKSIAIDTRVIAATNQNIAEMVQNRQFRQDLYYRLNVVSIMIPPLRDRKTDIPPLIDHFVKKINQKYQLHKKLSPELLKHFMEYDWPGNVRELENMIERILVTSEQDEVGYSPSFLPYAVKEELSETEEEIMPLKEAFEKVEYLLLKKAVKKYKTTYEIANALQISQPSVSRKLKKYKERNKFL
ncbi:MAG TPA: sigma 54-interacting transcriptional regulator [Candidatus Coprocola pullicola]|nr:sigma 54-interacting transcriptional regulator [Candidatus Coprocola pullicola]